ncbi:glutaredoxin family protein [Rhodococcus sp. (in: high G+C Gram-positive bacteria)]|uniref:glutaredoxin family protein n=1 Tax=Rhodococcus sp. TaxID=1831 RepID=UPI003BB0349A
MTVTVYTKPGCDQCKATYVKFDKAGIEYTVVDLTENPEARARVQGLGSTDPGQPAGHANT